MTRGLKGLNPRIDEIPRWLRIAQEDCACDEADRLAFVEPAALAGSPLRGFFF